VADDGQPHPLRADEPARRFDPDDAPVLHAKGVDPAVLDDVDAPGGRLTSVTPGDGVMSRRTRAALNVGAQNGMRGVRAVIQIRNQFPHLVPFQPLGLRAPEADEVGAADQRLARALVVSQKQHAASAEHDVEVEIDRQPLPQPQ